MVASSLPPTTRKVPMIPTDEATPPRVRPNYRDNLLDIIDRAVEELRLLPRTEIGRALAILYEAGVRCVASPDRSGTRASDS
jgi:hypothetical protein